MLNPTSKGQQTIALLYMKNNSYLIQLAQISHKIHILISRWY